MRRLLASIPLLLAVAAFPATAFAGAIDLRIAFSATGDSVTRTLTLRCGERPTGTVMRPAAACRRLSALGPAAFRPTPRDAACTELYGGPSTARITGIFFGRPLWVKLRRDNGCEIARWQRVAFLLPTPAAP